MTNIIKRILGRVGRLAIRASGGFVNSVWHPMTFGTFRNTSGEKVNNQTALTVSSLYACIRNVSEDIGKLPIKLYRKDGASRFEITDNPVIRLLQFQPNPEMDAMSFREAMNAQAMGWGNGYAEIQRDIRGVPVALWPLRPDRVKVLREKETNRVFYRVNTEDGHTSDIFAKDILHIHGLGFDGVVGYNIVQFASQSAGAAIAMDKFAGSYFANGMHQSGNLEHPSNLSKEAQDRLREQLQATYGGSEQAHQTLILEEGMKFTNTIIDPKASQMIETRRFSVTEFCRWMRVPPHKVADLTKSSFNNIEEQNIDYVQDGIAGWCKRWELSLWRKLLSEQEQLDGLFFEHNLEGLLRGNSKARAEFYKTLWDRGVLSIDEIRSRENMNPVPGGDARFVPLNVQRLEDVGNEPEMNGVIDDISSRLARREIKELDKRVKHAKDDMPRFRAWLDEFYEKHDKYIIETVEPLLFGCNRSVEVGLLSMQPSIKTHEHPAELLEYRKDKHADYIANNLRSYYEDRKLAI